MDSSLHEELCHMASVLDIAYQNKGESQTIRHLVPTQPL